MYYEKLHYDETDNIEDTIETPRKQKGTAFEQPSIWTSW